MDCLLCDQGQGADWITMWTMAALALEAIALHQSAHSRVAYCGASLLAYPITELLEGAGWIALDKFLQIVGTNLLLKRKLLRKIMAYLKQNLCYRIVPTTVACHVSRQT